MKYCQMSTFVILEKIQKEVKARETHQQAQMKYVPNKI